MTTDACARQPCGGVEKKKKTIIILSVLSCLLVAVAPLVVALLLCELVMIVVVTRLTDHVESFSVVLLLLPMSPSFCLML